MAGSPKNKAADLLLRAQVIERALYDRIVAAVAESQDRAEEVILESDLMKEADLLKALSGIYQTNYLSTERLSKADIPRSTVQMIPKRVAETLAVFPVMFDPKSSTLSVVTADPDASDTLREIKLVSGASVVKAFVARPAAVSAAIRKHHGGDHRAFDALDRQGLAYDFGQQVMSDGRVRSSKDSVRENAQVVLQPPPPPSVAERPRGRVVAMADDDPLARRRQPSSDAVPTSISAPPPPIPTAVRPPPPPMAQTQAPAAYRPQTEQPPAAEPLYTETTVELLTVMVSLLESTRAELRGHSSQVARLLKRIADRMTLEKNETSSVVIAGHIHDLGKMGQFHLTALNCAEYEGHRTAAAKAHDTPLRLLEAVRLTKSVKDAVFHMYERFDGKGFPDTLVGKEIPLGARLLAVADTYCDLTQNPRNPFRKVLSPAEAVDVLGKHRGTIFDPGIIDLIKSIVLGEDMRAKLLDNRHRALIVDPDPEEATVLELRLVEQGFDVKTARTIEAGKKLLSEGPEYDLVICEVTLPDGDGLAFLESARKESWGRDLLWVVHTAKQGRTEAQRAFDLGAMDFVAKPVQADVLVAKIKAMLDQWSNKKGPKGVSGSLQEMGLPDIVQVLYHGRKTGKLAIRANGKSGEIHFKDGAIHNALIGKLAGVDAFYAMLKLSEGDFALDPSYAPKERVITDSSEALLLEGMRRLDEGI